MVRYLVVLALVFGVGSCVGKQSGETRVEFVEVTRTKLVEAPTPEPERIEYVPQSCVDALEYAYQIGYSAEANYALSDEQLDIISDARLAVAGGGDLSSVENDQRRLQGRTVGNLAELEEALERFEFAYDECKEETE